MSNPNTFDYEHKSNNNKILQHFTMEYSLELVCENRLHTLFRLSFRLLVDTFKIYFFRKYGDYISSCYCCPLLNDSCVAKSVDH